MGKHSGATTRPPAATASGGAGLERPLSGDLERHVRAPWSLPLFASVVSLAFVLIAITDHSPAMAIETSAPGSGLATDLPAQALVATDDYVSSIESSVWKITEPPPPPPPAPTYGTAPAAGAPDPGTAKEIALGMVTARGWGSDQYDCLVALWSKESGWNVYAHNKSSGAYGIPQSLPGSKMASAGADWATNPATQIAWGLGYIAARYGDPCGAWGHSQRVGWY